MEIKQIIRGIIRENLNEGVEIDHTRYMRSHKKRASGSGQWIFTSKEMGDPSDDEMVTVNGSLSAASKEAAKKLKTNRVYVMESVELNENPWNQRLQKKPGTEELPAPAKGAVEKHGKKFKEGDMVVPHTGPHAGVPHKVTTARAGTVNIHPMVSVNNHKYDNTTIRAKHEHLSPYIPMKKESLDEVAIIKNGRKFSNVKWFETEKGANDFLEKNPEYGVLQSDSGGIYVALNKNKGTPLK
jgi:hypothetical protein